jgi:hypothetical protein
MEVVLRDICNVIVYIYYLLVHTKMDEKHFKVLNTVLERPHKNHFEDKLGEVRNKEVCLLTQIHSYARRN